MFKSKNSLKIVSLLAAVCLWLYVMGEVDPEMKTKVTDIPVSIANTEVLMERGLAAAYDEQITVNATVSGNRSDVNYVKKNGLTAYVDVAECDLGVNEEKININLPNGISLENISKSTLTFDVEYIAEASVPVVISFTEDTIVSGDSSEPKTPWVLDQDIDEVTVWGAMSSVKKIKEARGTIMPEKAAENKAKWVDVKLQPVDAKGKAIYGIEMSRKSTEAQVQLLTSKAVELELTADKSADIDIDKLDVPGTVAIAGTEASLKSIEKVEGIVTKDENGMINISVELPDKVFLLIGEDNGKIIWN